MAKVYLIALEVNLKKYKKNTEGNLKAVMMEGALGALGIRKKFSKFKADKILSSWEILSGIVARVGGSFQAETFYSTILPDSLHIKGGTGNAINNSFVFSALTGRRNEFERFLPIPRSAEQKRRAEEMTNDLGFEGSVEVGIMAFLDCEYSGVERVLLENRRNIELPSGEIHIFEYCDDKFIYPTFIDIDTGKTDGFLAGNVNSRLDMKNVRAHILSLFEKFLMAHRVRSMPPLEQVKQWLPVAKKKPLQKRDGNSSADIRTPNSKEKNKRNSVSKAELRIDFPEVANRLVNATLWMARKEDEIEAGTIFYETLSDWIKENNIDAHDLVSLPGELKAKLVEAIISHPDVSSGYDAFGGVARIEAEIYDNVQSDPEFAGAYPLIIKSIEAWSSRLS